jgi:Tol biopolymer transport system component
MLAEPDSTEDARCVIRGAALLVGILATSAGCTNTESRSDAPGSSTEPPTESCRDPDWSPREGTIGQQHDIAFVSDLGGSFDLWVIKPDGGQRRRLTNDAWMEVTPRWSPDGTSLAFACSTTEDGNFDLYVTSVGGSRDQVTATADCESSPAWSPDSSQIFFSANDCGDGPSTIRVLDLHNGEVEEITGHDSWFDLSPDGDSLVYGVPRSSGSFLDVGLWRSSADGIGANEITPAGIAAASEPTWSPDGRRIAFVAPSGDMDATDPVLWNEDIYVADSSGGELRRITSSPGNDHWPPAWSPDGRTLVYSADGLRNKAGILTAIDLRSREMTSVTKPGSNALFPTWRE